MALLSKGITKKFPRQICAALQINSIYSSSNGEYRTMTKLDPLRKDQNLHGTTPLVAPKIDPGNLWTWTWSQTSHQLLTKSGLIFGT